jgi:hypothetical protein
LSPLCERGNQSGDKSPHSKKMTRHTELRNVRGQPKNDTPGRY